jgi:hypothetical protein
MKILKLFFVTIAFVFFLSSCNSSKHASAQHNRGVNNRHYAGY